MKDDDDQGVDRTYDDTSAEFLERGRLERMFVQLS